MVEGSLTKILDRRTISDRGWPTHESEIWISAVSGQWLLGTLLWGFVWDGTDTSQFRNAQRGEPDLGA